MQPPASPPLPSPAPSADSPRIRLPRWLAGSLLVAGGLLAGLALFLPWVRESLPAMAGDPPYTHIDSPGTGNVLNALVVLVVPISLAVLGMVILCKPGWTPPAGARGGALILVAIGVGEILLVIVFYLYVAGALDVILPARTVEIGPGVALLGYLCALVGAVWLPPRARRLER